MAKCKVDSSWPAGTLLWARIPGHCPWPALATPATDATTSTTTSRLTPSGRVEHHVHFLGYDKLRGWVADKDATLLSSCTEISFDRFKLTKKRARRVREELRRRFEEALKVVEILQEQSCTRRLQSIDIYSEEEREEEALGEERRGDSCQASAVGHEDDHVGQEQPEKRALEETSSAGSESDESLHLFLDTEDDDDDDDGDDGHREEIHDEGESKEVKEPLCQVEDNNNKGEERSLEQHWVGHPGTLCWARISPRLWWPCIISLPRNGGPKVIEAEVVYHHVHLFCRKEQSKWVTEIRAFDDIPQVKIKIKKVRDNLEVALKEAEKVRVWSCEQRHLHLVGRSAKRRREEREDLEVIQDCEDWNEDDKNNDYGFPGGDVDASLLPLDWQLSKDGIVTPYGRSFLSLKTAINFLFMEISANTNRRQPFKRSISMPSLIKRHPQSLRTSVDFDHSSFVLNKFHQSGRLNITEKSVRICGDLATERVSLYHDPFLEKSEYLEIVRPPLPSVEVGLFYVRPSQSHFFEARRDLLQCQVTNSNGEKSLYCRQILDLEHLIRLYGLKQSFVRWLSTRRLLYVSVTRLPRVFLDHKCVIGEENDNGNISFVDAETREFVAMRVNTKFE